MIQELIIIFLVYKKSILCCACPLRLYVWPLQAQSVAVEAQTNAGLSERIATLEQEVARYKEDAGKGQVEVDRLLEILREMENEKNDKDRKISELERYTNVHVYS